MMRRKSQPSLDSLLKQVERRLGRKLNRVLRHTSDLRHLLSSAEAHTPVASSLQTKAPQSAQPATPLDPRQDPFYDPFAPPLTPFWPNDPPQEDH